MTDNTQGRKLTAKSIKPQYEKVAKEHNTKMIMYENIKSDIGCSMLKIMLLIGNEKVVYEKEYWHRSEIDLNDFSSFIDRHAEQEKKDRK